VVFTHHLKIQVVESHALHPDHSGVFDVDGKGLYVDSSLGGYGTPRFPRGIAGVGRIDPGVSNHPRAALVLRGWCQYPRGGKLGLIGWIDGPVKEILVSDVVGELQHTGSWEGQASFFCHGPLMVGAVSTVTMRPGKPANWKLKSCPESEEPEMTVAPE